MATFLLIRHGLTDDVGVRLSGRAPGLHLNREGRAQAAALADSLEGVRIAAVFSSPLERAIETARPIAERRGLSIEIAVGFSEFDFGEWTGRTHAELQTDPTWQRFNAVRSTTRPPGGESMLDVQCRAWAALVNLDERYPAAVVAIVSHGDVIRGVLLEAAGIPLDFVHRVEISPARISILQFSRGGPAVLQVNGDSARLASGT